MTEFSATDEQMEHLYQHPSSQAPGTSKKSVQKGWKSEKGGDENDRKAVFVLGARAAMGALAVLPDDPGLIPSTHTGSQLSVTPVLGSPISSSLQGQQAHT